MLTQQQIDTYFEKSGSTGSSIHYDLKYDFFDDGSDLQCDCNDKHDVLSITIDADGKQFIHTEERGTLEVSPGAKFTFNKVSSSPIDEDEY